MTSCDGCGRQVYSFANPCLPCVRARHRAAVTHRCACPSKLRRLKECQVYSRRWLACLRCLGTYKQLS
jgi:hypothetical protein